MTSRHQEARARYDRFRERPASLDMTRGKPAPAQLDLSAGLLAGDTDVRAADGTDCRNYGGLEGLPEARKLFGEMLEMKPDLIMAGGNSSLSAMHEVIVHAMLHGVPDGKGPWLAERPRFICPVPGYDRHFSICEHLGIEMIPVAMNEHGPDQEAVERLVSSDPRIKGMWMVPKYGNPTGVTLSAESVRALARMKTAAPDFRILWDNAYAVHDLTDTPDVLLNGHDAGEAAGHANRFLTFASFSKITYAGASMSAFAGSPDNIAWMRGHHANTTIGPDKMVQLRHVRLLKNGDGIRALMKQHAAILRPKFEAVERVLSRELGGTGLATWTRPRGGYFVSIDTKDGMAAKVVKSAADAGVKLTPAGSSFPHRKDPNDRNIRIAPSFPSVGDVEKAIEVLAVSILALDPAAS